MRRSIATPSTSAASTHSACAARRNAWNPGHGRHAPHRRPPEGGRSLRAGIRAARERAGERLQDRTGAPAREVGGRSSATRAPGAARPRSEPRRRRSSSASRRGAMSFGSISKEAHETLAIAMNEIGGKSIHRRGAAKNFRALPADGPHGGAPSARRSIRSPRAAFGRDRRSISSTPTMMQIKVAQGAKPGEGGQLPGHQGRCQDRQGPSLDPGRRADLRPPPHHDIYSSEDLGQLIFDLKNVNPDAAVSGEARLRGRRRHGRGERRQGTAPTTSRSPAFEGGTGASPLTSIKHAGSPWEMGLAETHRRLVLNRLRGGSRGAAGRRRAAHRGAT